MKYKDGTDAKIGDVVREETHVCGVSFIVFGSLKSIDPRDGSGVLSTVSKVKTLANGAKQVGTDKDWYVRLEECEKIG